MADSCYCPEETTYLAVAPACPQPVRKVVTVTTQDTAVHVTDLHNHSHATTDIVAPGVTPCEPGVEPPRRVVERDFTIPLPFFVRAADAPQPRARGPAQVQANVRVTPEVAEKIVQARNQHRTIIRVCEEPTCE